MAEGFDEFYMDHLSTKYPEYENLSIEELQDRADTLYLVVIPYLHSEVVACSDEMLVNKYVLNYSSLLCLSNC